MPFTILRDTAEQHPWTFTGLRADADKNYRPLLVPCRSRYLGEGNGDYTIEGCESRIAVERKSIADAFGTILGNRDRFVRELEHLNATREYAAVIVEGDWTAIATCNLHHWNEQGLSAEQRARRRKTVIRSILAWQLRYPIVRWWPMPDRAAAEVWCFRILEKWWKDNVKDNVHDAAT